MAALEDAADERPALRIGCVADVQWADADDGWNYDRTNRRRYRGALAMLERAVAYWNRERCAFVAQLGDLIDGQNARSGASARALDAALSALARCETTAALDGVGVGGVVHLIGNHELYNFDRAELAARLHTAPEPGRVEYYSFAPAPGWRVLVLDPYQDAVIGWPHESAKGAAARAFLSAQNPNIASGGDWTAGLRGDARRFVPYNGGFGAEQIAWLRSALERARADGERALVLSHVVLHPRACDGSTMAWDCDAALGVLGEPSLSGVVVAVLCGHDHKAGYARDAATGIHHLTFQSPLNRGDDGACFGVVDVYEERLELRGPALEDWLPASLVDGRGGGTPRVVLPFVSRGGCAANEPATQPSPPRGEPPEEQMSGDPFGCSSDRNFPRFKF